MNQQTFSLLENYMLSCMEDSAHDSEHIYRVLYSALDIARTEEHVDYDVLISSCLLHDIGRKEQFEHPKLCHARVGGDKAYQFLTDNHFSDEFAEKVRACIQTHSYRKDHLPQSVEAKILFDADKIDVAGTIGIARTLIYKGQVSEPLYTRLEDGSVSDGTNDTLPSFFQEYRYKLEHLYSHFYTKRGMEIAAQRQRAAKIFYDELFHEVNSACKNGQEMLKDVLQKKTE